MQLEFLSVRILYGKLYFWLANLFAIQLEFLSVAFYRVVSEFISLFFSQSFKLFIEFLEILTIPVS